VFVGGIREAKGYHPGGEEKVVVGGEGEGAGKDEEWIAANFERGVGR
jgi:hypothetical protein